MSEQFSDDDWLTPQDILQRLGHFDLDPAMSVVKPWRTADIHYDKNADGLKLPWFGRVWLNPPYSDMEPWIDRLIQHIRSNGTGLALVNARTETRWFFDGIWKLCDSIFFPDRRFKFVRPDGNSASTGRMGSAIAAYSEEDSKLLYAADLGGKFICLKFKVPQNIQTTWRSIVRAAMTQLGGECTNEQLYELISGHPRAQTREHWKAKVRQVLQLEGEMIKEGQWKL